MNPTQYIIEKSGMQPYKEGDYLAFNSGGIECEVGEFLYGLVRVTKPKCLLETGTHKGISSSYIGLALKENNQNGQLFTIEFDSQHWQDAENLFVTLGLIPNVTQGRKKVENFDLSDWNIDILFLDTEPDQRFAELVRFFPNVKPGGYILIHDLHNHLSQELIPDAKFPYWPFGKLPEEIKNWLKDDQLRLFHFPTPRGLSCFYKPRENDYRWYK